MALPIMTESDKVSTFFDCKIRRLFVHIPKAEKKEVIKEVEEAPESQVDEEVNLNNDIVEDEADDDIEVIDTDDHFGRENTGKVQKQPKKEPKIINSNDLDDDLLYDLC